ncbi:hypothetical protein V6N12_046011 [Hibiscus sabdariffa]|uniref:Uncharacterized protein n=1 Tax=Hibiscus sabdariffa TaxID=183260 RepID=A0ABR2G4Q3_9ROSI
MLVSLVEWFTEHLLGILEHTFGRSSNVDIVQVSFLVMERGPSWLLSEIDVLDDCSFEGDIKSLRSYNNRRETFLGMTWSIELKGASAA